MANNQKLPKVMQFKVFQRFMSEEELQQMITGYYSHARSSKRIYSLSAQIERPDMEMMEAYLLETDTPIKVLAEKFDVSSFKFTSVARATAIRYLFQHPEIWKK